MHLFYCRLCALILPRRWDLLVLINKTVNAIQFKRKNWPGSAMKYWTSWKIDRAYFKTFQQMIDHLFAVNPPFFCCPTYCYHVLQEIWGGWIIPFSWWGRKQPVHKSHLNHSPDAVIQSYWPLGPVQQLVLSTLRRTNKTNILKKSPFQSVTD